MNRQDWTERNLMDWISTHMDDWKIICTRTQEKITTEQFDRIYEELKRNGFTELKLVLFQNHSYAIAQRFWERAEELRKEREKQ